MAALLVMAAENLANREICEADPQAVTTARQTESKTHEFAWNEKSKARPHRDLS